MAMSLTGWPGPTESIFFENEESFPMQSEEDKARRAALWAAAKRDDLMSYYEARSLPKNEIVAMAVAREEIAHENDNRDKDPILGKTADGFCFDAGELHSVFMIPDDPTRQLERCQVKRISEYGYLVDLQYDDETILVPSRIIFESEDIAKFMQQELMAYTSAPDVRT